MSDSQGRSYFECGKAKCEYLMLASSCGIEIQSPGNREKGHVCRMNVIYTYMYEKIACSKIDYLN